MLKTTDQVRAQLLAFLPNYSEFPNSCVWDDMGLVLTEYLSSTVLSFRFGFGFTFCMDTLEKDAGGFVVGILRDEFS